MNIFRRLSQNYTEEEMQEIQDEMIKNTDWEDVVKPHQDPFPPPMKPNSENLIEDIALLIHHSGKLLKKIFKDF